MYWKKVTVKGFLLRSISCILILVLMIVSACLTLYMCRWSGDYDSCRGLLLAAMIFGDALIPLLLFSPALILRSKTLSMAAIICSLFNIFVRLSSIIVLKETFMPLNYESLKILLIHSDLYSIEAFLGRGFYFWLVPILLLLLTMVTTVCAIVWKSSGKRFGKVIKLWTLFFCVLLSFSVISNCMFLIVRPDRTTSSLINTLPLISAQMVDDVLREVSRKKHYIRTVLPERSREILANYHVIAGDDLAKKRGECKFDRIIIIAVESLDYDFISGINPGMPAEVTPNLEYYCRNYLSLKNYYTASQPTSWGLNSLLLSRFDYERDRFIQLPSFFTVARKQGFYTGYFSAASGLFGNNRQIYEKLFDADKMFFLEDWRNNYRMTKQTSWGIPDDKLFEGVYEELKKINQTRFAVVISTMDTHPPYYVPEKEKKDEYEKNSDELPVDGGHEVAGNGEKVAEKDKPVARNKFLRSLNHTDRCIGDFVAKVMADEELFDEKSMIIITADHSATHGENYLKRDDFDPERIPLIFIVKDPSALDGIDSEKFASSVDLAPTLVKLIGMNIPESFMGRPLFSPKDLAISRLFGDILLVRDKSGCRLIDCYSKTTSEEDQAFVDFYFSHYGK